MRIVILLALLGFTASASGSPPVAYTSLTVAVTWREGGSVFSQASQASYTPSQQIEVEGFARATTSIAKDGELRIESSVWAVENAQAVAYGFADLAIPVAADYWVDAGHYTAFEWSLDGTDHEFDDAGELFHTGRWLVSLDAGTHRLEWGYLDAGLHPGRDMASQWLTVTAVPEPSSLILAVLLGTIVQIAATRAH